MSTNKKPIKEGYVYKTGAYIVQRYLCDDLWETEQIDNIFNLVDSIIMPIKIANACGQRCQIHILQAE